MKKMPIFILCLFAFCSIIFSGCSFDVYSASLENIAESVFVYSEAEDDLFKITFSSGMREDPYITNGVAEKTVPYTVVMLQPKTDKLKNNLSVQGKVSINGAQQNIVLDKNPYDYNFGVDLGLLTEDIRGLEISVVFDEEERVFKMPNNLEGFAVTWESALKKATEVMPKTVKEVFDTNGQTCEVYVKVVSDQTKTTNDLFYYVSFYTSNDLLAYCLIDKTGAVFYKSAE